MADIPLFQVRKHSGFFLSALYRNAVCLGFAIFMLLGNFSRLIPLRGFPSNLSIFEFILYALTLPAYFMRLRKSYLLPLGIALSSTYGAMLNGFDWISTLYALKLIGMIGSAVVLGELFLSKEELISFFLRVFGGVTLLGFVFFLVFPKAENIFFLLENYGIRFHGDPHMRRFISPFFDPNYYAAIGSLALLLAYQTKRWKFFALLLLSIILTFSRSGLATCGMVLITIFFRAKKKFSYQGFFALFFCLLTLLFSQELSYLWKRTLNFLRDPSALARLETFQVALSFFWEHPFFGIGYNYLSKMFEEAFGRLSPDSSVLIFLVNFGLIPFFFMVFGAIWWVINYFLRRRDVSLFYFYVVVCVLFTSFFNNLLLYPYWLIPVGALMTRIGGDQLASRADPRLAHPDGRG